MTDPDSHIERVYARYFPLIRAKCRRTLGDLGEAQDVAQETFLRLWRSYPGLRDEPQAISAWIYRTATRLSIDRIRARQLAVVGQVAEDPQDQRGDPEGASQARAMLRHVARRLSAAELEVTVLVKVDGLSQAEAAEVLSCSERTVRRVLRRVERALAALREDSR